MKKLYNSGYVHEHVIMIRFVCIEFLDAEKCHLHS